MYLVGLHMYYKTIRGPYYIKFYSLMIIQYLNINRNKYKNYVLQSLSSEHIILKFYCNYCISIHSAYHLKSFHVSHLARLQ